MQHIMYTKPFTRINEFWNIYNNTFDSSPSDQYADPLITSPANNFYADTMDLQAEWYQHVAVDIITETVFNYPHAQITEKTLRPISSKRMFIMVGAPYTLRFLESKGFITFSPFINETYDIITDPNDRIALIITEIKKICAIPIAEMSAILLEHKDILEHNFNVLRRLRQTEREDFTQLLDTL